MVKLINNGKIVLATATVTEFSVMRNDAKIGTAYRQESGAKRGNYEFDNQTFSRARLISTLSK